MLVLPRKKYRSTIGIIYDILKLLRDNGPATISQLIREANVPYVRLKPILEKLSKNGYVIIKKTAQVDIAITRKGLNFLAQLDLLKKKMDDMGLNI